MSSNVIRFPTETTRTFQQEKAESALMEDPKYKFIYDLLTAVSEVGLPFDGTPGQKAREVYARCQRENVFSGIDLELSSRRDD